MIHLLKRAVRWFENLFMSEEAQIVRDMYGIYLDAKPHPKAAKEWKDMLNAIKNVGNRMYELERRIEELEGREYAPPALADKARNLLNSPKAE